MERRMQDTLSCCPGAPWQAKSYGGASYWSGSGKANCEMIVGNGNLWVGGGGSETCFVEARRQKLVWFSDVKMEKGNLCLVSVNAMVCWALPVL